MKKVFLALTLAMTLLALTSCSNNSERAESTEENPFDGRLTSYKAGNYTHVVVDQQTGVCYLFYNNYNEAALSVMLNADGSPVVMEMNEN